MSIRVESIRKTFGAFTALEDINLDVARGGLVGLLGPSGSGKTTLLRIIAGLEKPDRGRVFFHDRDVTNLDARRRRVGFVFQQYALFRHLTVADNVAFGLRMLPRGERPPRDAIRARVRELLELVQMDTMAGRYPAQLSGGQKQRVGIARALACRPTILLCDEATSALDPQTTQSVLKLLGDINKELGLTIVLITHEMDVVRRVCDRVAVMDAGRVVEMGPVSEVFLHPQHPTTRDFVFESENVDRDELQEDLQKAEGRILRLTFKGESTYKPLLGSVARESGVDFSILSGRIDHIKDTPYGQLTLSLVGGDLEVAMKALEAAEVHVEVVR